ncbi:hypothetical protein, partial [Brevibacillus laterosporus]|uniref:hypothetical protein n=1 Tax=Brevibacillus laterosporus TaxID=1465 RepID=UPI001EF2F1A7
RASESCLFNKKLTPFHYIHTFNKKACRPPYLSVFCLHAEAVSVLLTAFSFAKEQACAIHQIEVTADWTY